MKSLRCLGTLVALAAAFVATAQLSWTARSSASPGFYTARANFPKWDAGTRFQQWVSDQCESFADAQLEEFVSFARRLGSERPAHGPYVFELKTELAYVSPRVISATTAIFSDTQGAHPSTTLVPVTYGIVGDRPARLSFRDALRPGIDPLRVANEFLLPGLNRIKRQRGADPLTQLGPPMVNHFMATPAGITWQFGPYVAGAYAEGTYVVKVPWSDLARFINPNGPLGQFVSVAAGDDEMVRSNSVHLIGTAFFLERLMVPGNAQLDFILTEAKPGANGKFLVLKRERMPARPDRTPFEVAFVRKNWANRESKRLVIELSAEGKVWFRSEPIQVPYDGWESRQEIRLIRVMD